MNKAVVVKGFQRRVKKKNGATKLVAVKSHFAFLKPRKTPPKKK